MDSVWLTVQMKFLKYANWRMMTGIVPPSVADRIRLQVLATTDIGEFRLPVSFRSSVTVCLPICLPMLGQP